MSVSGSGRSYRACISLQGLFRLFPNDQRDEDWFIKRQWPYGVVCPHCGSVRVQDGAKHKCMRFRCREKECTKRFSTKTGTVIAGSKLGYQTWLVAAYNLSTSLKSESTTSLRETSKSLSDLPGFWRTGYGPRSRSNARDSRVPSMWTRRT